MCAKPNVTRIEQLPARVYLTLVSLSLNASILLQKEIISEKRNAVTQIFESICALQNKINELEFESKQLIDRRQGAGWFDRYRIDARLQDRHQQVLFFAKQRDFQQALFHRYNLIDCLHQLDQQLQHLENDKSLVDQALKCAP